MIFLLPASIFIIFSWIFYQLILDKQFRQIDEIDLRETNCLQLRSHRFGLTKFGLVFASLAQLRQIQRGGMLLPVGQRGFGGTKESN